MTNWIDSLFGKQEISKEATIVPTGKDAQDTTDRKIKASGWMLDVAAIDPDQVDKEYNAQLVAEAKMIGKTAAYEAYETMEETLKRDYARDVKALSDYALAEWLMDIRGHKAQNLPEKYVELKEEAKKDVKASREKCEKEVLEHVGMSAQLDWKKAFEKYSKEAKPEEVKKEDLFQPTLDKIDEKEWSTGKKDDKDFIISDKEKTTQAGAGNGREEDERTDVTKQPGEPQEKKAALKVDAFLVRDPETELSVGNKVTLARSIMAMGGEILNAGGDYTITGREGERFVITANGKNYSIARFDTPKFFRTASKKVATNDKKAYDEVTTTDFSRFGSRERAMVRQLLEAWEKQGLPEDFSDDEVVPMMNMNSGNVFLTNSNYEVAMMNGDKLESFYSCPECGHEGFKDEMQHEGDAECQRYLKDIGVIESEPVEEINPESSKKAELVKDSPANKKDNITLPVGKETSGDKPEEAVKETTLPADKKEVGDKADRAEEKNSFDKGNDVDTIEAVNKKAHEGTDHVAEMCPVCGSQGKDLANGLTDHYSCIGCGISYGHKQGSCGHCGSKGTEIKNYSSKDEVLKMLKTAEVQSPWVVVEKDGQEMIARREEVPTVEKKSEEEKKLELQK
jgi:hypothetical protein